MRINTNISAMNASRNLWSTQQSIDSSMSKLSSGFRINRAADDAAGLGISNKLRADIRAMGQASRNTEQANSLLQIAEGSVGTIQKMLERMKELAAQSASDTVDAGGRTSLNDEFGKLKAEITRTVNTTKFQGQTLLDGGFGSTVNQAAATSTMLADGTTVSAVRSSGAGAGTYTIAHTANTLTMTGPGGDTEVIDVTGKTGRQDFSFARFGITISTEEAFVPGTPAAGQFAGNIVVTAGQGTFLVGSSGQYTGADTIKIDSLDVSLATLGLTAEGIDNRDNAAAALGKLDAAFSVVNTALGTIGATQNQLDYAQQNIKVAIQNFSAAESVIRDVDMAEEMTRFSKSNILAQAGTAMLAQANQSAQGVLQLLRG